MVTSNAVVFKYHDTVMIWTVIHTAGIQRAGNVPAVQYLASISRAPDSVFQERKRAKQNTKSLYVPQAGLSL